MFFFNSKNFTYKRFFEFIYKTSIHTLTFITYVHIYVFNAPRTLRIGISKIKNFVFTNYL